MKTITEKNKVTIAELNEMSQKMFGNFVKAVVDIEKAIMVVDADLHADEERVLLDQGSKQENLWGINFHPEFSGTEDFIEFDSMVNIRPWQNNRSRDVENSEIRKKIRLVTDKLVMKN